MTPEGAVCERILELGGVTAIVGSRVYLDKLPQLATYPLVFVQLVTEGTDDHLRGAQRRQARVQVDAYVQEGGSADPMDAVMTLADAIHGDDAGSGLSAWHGSIGSPSFQVTAVLRIDRARGYEPDDLKLVRIRQDYRVHFAR